MSRKWLLWTSLAILFLTVLSAPLLYSRYPGMAAAEPDFDHEGSLVIVAPISFLIPFSTAPATSTGKSSPLGNSAVSGTDTISLAGGIVMSATSAITITGISFETACDSAFGIASPISQTIFSRDSSAVGKSEILGPFAAGTNLIFWYASLPETFCYHFPVFSDDPSHARVTQQTQNSWQIGWDDAWAYPDHDYNDFVVKVAMGGPAQWPDLMVQTVTDPPASISIGGSFSIGDWTKNYGLGTAGASTTRYYLSLDQYRSVYDILLTGGRSVPALAPATSSSGTAVVTVPSGTAAGSYYIVTCADDMKVVAESDENNNCRSSASLVAVTSPGSVSIGVDGITNGFFNSFAQASRDNERIDQQFISVNPISTPTEADYKCL